MKHILHLNKLNWDINKIEANLNGTIYSNGYERISNYFENGRHAIYFNNSSEKYGFKFFIVKGICYEQSKIEELYEIHLQMFSAGFGVEVFGLCSCYYNGKIHYGLQVEKLSRCIINRKHDFPIESFKTFCRSVNGLIKREHYYEKTYGEKWYQKFPHLEFNVGDNNIMYDNNGNPKIIDIDPRWQIKK